jgi:hypothetical protein
MMMSGALMGCADTPTEPVLPNPPEAVTANLTSLRYVEITWQARPGSENIVSYSIYRDGLFMGETATLSAIDSIATQASSHEYSVASHSADGVVSERSAPVSIFVPDRVAPTILTTTPADGAMNVSQTPSVQARFSEPMDPSSITPSTLTVKDAITGSEVAGSLTYNSSTRTATWVASPALPPERRFIVSVTTGIKDVAGNPVSNPVSFSFTVRETGAPFVTGFTPPDGSVLPIGTFPTVSFSERMGNLDGVLWLTQSGSLVSRGGSFDTLTNTVTIRPGRAIQSFVPYTILVGASALDVAGNPVASSVSFTISYGEWSLPRITSTTPANGSTGVALNTVLWVDVDPAIHLVNDYDVAFNLRVTGSSTLVLPSIRRLLPSGTRYELAFFEPLQPNTSYTAVFYHFFTDSKGVRHEEERVWTFTTR